MWHAAGGWSQPGAAQCRSLVMIARRRCGGMDSVTAPMSSGRLIEAAGFGRVPVRSQEARPPGPDSRAAARLRMSSRAQAVLSSPFGPSWSGAAGWQRAPHGQPGPHSARRPGCRVSCAGELVEQVMIDRAGDDRGDRRVAVIAEAGRGAVVRGPGSARRARRQPAGAVQELVEGEVQLQLDGLPGPVRQAPRGQQAAECLLERVVVTLDPGAGVLRPGLFPQRLQHRGEGGGAAAGEVAVQPPGAAQRGG